MDARNVGSVTEMQDVIQGKLNQKEMLLGKVLPWPTHINALAPSEDFTVGEGMEESPGGI